MIKKKITYTIVTLLLVLLHGVVAETDCGMEEENRPDENRAKVSWAPKNKSITKTILKSSHQNLRLTSNSDAETMLPAVPVATIHPHHDLLRGGDDDEASERRLRPSWFTNLFQRKRTQKKVNMCRIDQTIPTKFRTVKVSSNQVAKRLDLGDMRGACVKYCDRLCPRSTCDLVNGLCIEGVCTPVQCPDDEICHCRCEDQEDPQRFLTWTKPKSKKVVMCEIDQMNPSKFRTVKVRRTSLETRLAQGNMLFGRCCKSKNKNRLCPGMTCDEASGQCRLSKSNIEPECTGVTACPGQKCICECKRKIPTGTSTTPSSTTSTSSTSTTPTSTTSTTTSSTSTTPTSTTSTSTTTSSTSTTPTSTTSTSSTSTTPTSKTSTSSTSTTPKSTTSTSTTTSSTSTTSTPKSTTSTSSTSTTPKSTTSTSTTTSSTSTTPKSTTSTSTTTSSTSTTPTSTTSTTTSSTSTTPTSTTSTPSTPGYGLQSSCLTNDEDAYNVCLDLNSLSGVFEDWMNELIQAAKVIESIVTNNLPPISGPSEQPGHPSLGFLCTAYPALIDDIYICAKDRIYPPPRDTRTIASAGPYLVRRGLVNGVEVPVLPVAARISVNVNFVNLPDLEKVLVHELFHTLGFPSLSSHYGWFTGPGYPEGFNADAAWKEMGCSGSIPLQDCNTGTCSVDASGIPRPGHWNEACLVDELMTPIATGNHALSKISIGALEDLGYGVNYSVAEDYTINDLGDCGAHCLEALPSNGDNSFIRGSIKKRLKRTIDKAEKDTVMNDFKYDLFYFHEQVEKAGYVKGNENFYCQEDKEGEGLCALEQIDVFYVDSDGEYHDFFVTYDDVKDLYSDNDWGDYYTKYEQD